MSSNSTKAETVGPIPHIQGAVEQLAIMVTPLVYLLLASPIPPTWATTPTRRPGGRRTSPTRVPGGEGFREEVGRRGRAVEEGAGCQDEATIGLHYRKRASPPEEPHLPGMVGPGAPGTCTALCRSQLLQEPFGESAPGVWGITSASPVVIHHPPWHSGL